MRPIVTLAAALVGLAALPTASAQSTTQTLSGTLTGTVTLDASQVYLLDGEVYVDNGAVLNIPAGTVLKGKRIPTQGNGQASVLVVQRGGMLNATGTAQQPVIFTAESDNVADAFDTNGSVRGLWGGVILLGNANNNRGPRTIEGVPPTLKSTYGPDAAAGFPEDLNDNSGTLRYVSIRHAGFTLNPDEEINGLTLGAIGAGTTLEYIEVFANSDDSFEFFGGNVNAKYLVGSFSGDDDFDWDTGFRGKLEFLFSLKDRSGDVGRCIEGDGSASPFTAAGQSSPVVSNLTCVGSGLGSVPGGSDEGGPTLKLRENTGGFVYNSVFTQYQTANGGIDLEQQAKDSNGNNVGGSEVSTEQNFFDGELDIRNNLFYDYSAGNTAQAIVRFDNAALETAIADRNRFVPGGLLGVGNSTNRSDPNPRAQDGVLDPRPAAGAESASGASFTLDKLTGDAFFTPVGYLGAFAPAPKEIWARGWTALASLGYFSDASQQPVASEGGPEGGAFGLTVGPNPMRDGGTVRVSLDQAQEVRLALYDVLGRQVQAVTAGTFAAGTTPVAISTAGLPSGVYVLRLEGEGVAATTRISIVR